MLVEQELCRKLVDIFAAALTGVDVQGNWLPSDGWDMSAPTTVDDPESDMPAWTCTLSRPLEKVMHTEQAQS